MFYPDFAISVILMLISVFVAGSLKGRQYKLVQLTAWLCAVFFLAKILLLLVIVIPK